MLHSLPPADRARIEALITRHHARLARARGFLGARPGFPLAHGVLVREPAIIAYVRAKVGAEYVPGDEALPRELDGVRVDVVVADPHTQLELLGETGRFPETFAEAEPTYIGLDGDPIDAEFTVTAPVLCHVGPDTGWVVLRDFLALTRAELTGAMYDFNADYIATTLIDAADTHHFPIRLALDDSTDAASELPIQERLRDRLHDAYDATTIVCRSGARFPTAYHEKVAVRDHTAFWLSSGNWTRTSQPRIDPIGDPASAGGLYSKGNREWHLVVDDAALADVFERYIEHDRAQARLDAEEAGFARMALPDLFVPLEALLAEAETAAEAAPVPVAPAPLPAGGATYRVRALLSPDNYARRVRELVESAAERLYLQYSYINWSSKPRDERFREVLDLLAERSWRDEFDLRIIVNSRDAAQKVRVLAENGFNEQVFRAQSRVHNKGIVADGRRVLVSSQNWSGDGFLRNRDAGVIVEQPEVAAYYERVFLDDWERRARSPFTEGLDAIVAREGEPTPPGRVRMTWRDYYGEA